MRFRHVRARSRATLAATVRARNGNAARFRYGRADRQPMSEVAARRTWLTVAEVAQRLGLHREVVRRKIRSGQIPAVRLGEHPKSHLRVDERELERWLRS